MPYSRIVLRFSSDFFRTLVSSSTPDIISRLRAQEHFVLRIEGTAYRYLEDYFHNGIREFSEQAPLWELSLCANTVSLLVHISPSTLSKLFLGKMGISFYHFVTQRRLINSKAKIEQGRSLEEAALSCGFSDYSAFYRALKKEYGMSPREYRKLLLPF